MARTAHPSCSQSLQVHVHSCMGIFAYIRVCAAQRTVAFNKATATSSTTSTCGSSRRSYLSVVARNAIIQQGGQPRRSSGFCCCMAKADSTLRSSQAVPHPSTDRALCCLTSEVERDPVHSTRYDRQRIPDLQPFCGQSPMDLESIT